MLRPLLSLCLACSFDASAGWLFSDAVDEFFEHERCIFAPDGSNAPVRLLDREYVAENGIVVGSARKLNEITIKFHLYSRKLTFALQVEKTSAGYRAVGPEGLGVVLDCSM